MSTLFISAIIFLISELYHRILARILVHFQYKLDNYLAGSLVKANNGSKLTLICIWLDYWITVLSKRRDKIGSKYS